MQFIQVSLQIRKATASLIRKCQTFLVIDDLLVFGSKTKRSFHRACLLRPVSNVERWSTGHCFSVQVSFHRACLLRPVSNVIRWSTGRCFSAQVSFDNQPPSWLFVNRSVGGAYGAQVNLELDLDRRLSGESLEKLKTELKLRGIQVDVDELAKEYKEMRVYEKKKHALDAKRDNLQEEIKLLQEENTPDDKKVQSLQEELNKIRTEMAEIKAFGDLEHKVMLTALKLPNDLHPSTPVDGDLIIREVKGKLEPQGKQSHVNIAKKFDLIKFSNVGPKAYYLKTQLALAEMTLSKAAWAYMESHNYRAMAGPEFFKTPIMEGCGYDIHNADEVLTMLSTTKDLIEPMNHLAGVTLPTFAAYVAKTCIGNSILPLNMFSCGRCYQNGNLPGLFGAVQSTQATLFSCVQKENLDNQFDQNVDIVWNFLEPLGFPLRMVQICARDLRLAERRRLEVQMYAPSLQQFVPVAHVSDLSDFVSRRLMVIHNQNHADIRSASLVHMNSGSLVNITSLLALWMEYGNTHQELFSLCPLDFNNVRKSRSASL